MSDPDRQILFDVGDQVEFLAGSHGQLVGTVTKLNPKRAVVSCENRVWDVPYKKLCHVCNTIRLERSARTWRLKEVASQAHDLMNHYGLHDWSLKFNSSRRQLGACDHKRKRIILSRIQAVHRTRDQVTDVILHEIAHALAGWKAGHGPAWKEVAIQLGARPRACAPESDEVQHERQEVKANVRVGDSVSFNDRKHQVHKGVILRKNPKTATVQGSSCIWRVPYSGLTVLQHDHDLE